MKQVTYKGNKIQKPDNISMNLLKRFIDEVGEDYAITIDNALLVISSVITQKDCEIWKLTQKLEDRQKRGFKKNDLSKQDIFESGTNDYCSPTHVAKMYAEGNCPFGDVEMAISSAMDLFANQKLEKAIELIRKSHSNYWSIEYLITQIKNLKVK